VERAPLVFDSHRDGESIEFVLHEPKDEVEGGTKNWGDVHSERFERPLWSWLFRARSIFERTWHPRAQFDPAAAILVTTVSLPLLVA